MAEFVVNDVPAPSVVRRRNTPVAYIPASVCDEVDMTHIDAMLDREITFSRNESWSKLNPHVRTELLHAFADKHAVLHELSSNETLALKELLSANVSRGKLKRAKDVDYDQPLRIVRAISALTFDKELRLHSLRNLDPARVSTLKSLTPKRAATFKHSTGI